MHSMFEGFFTQLFNQIVALLSAFGLTITPTTGLPNRLPETFASGPATTISREISAPQISVQEQPLAIRAIQTQLNAVAGIGKGLATTADATIATILGLPRTLADGVDNDSGGVANLPGAFAGGAGDLVTFAERGSQYWISTTSAIVLSELDLLCGGCLRARSLALDPGAAAEFVEPAPLPQRFIDVQIDGLQGIGRALNRATTGIGDALIDAPDLIRGSIDRGGLMALPAGFSAATAGVVRATAAGASGIVAAVAEMARNELRLIPGAEVNGGPKLNTVDVIALRAPGEEEETNLGGPVALVVRFPLAVAVAGSDLVLTGLSATTLVTGGFVKAASDIVRSVTGARTPPNSETSQLAAVEQERLTLPQALAKAPATIRQGFVDAGAEVRTGTRRAAQDFNNTLRGGPAEREQRALTAGGGAIVRSTSSGDTATLNKPDVVQPNRPRPVLGAVKAVTGTLKAVRNGIRTALGLPTRKTRPDPTQQKVGDEAPAAS